MVNQTLKTDKPVKGSISELICIVLNLKFIYMKEQVNLNNHSLVTQ